MVTRHVVEVLGLGVADVSAELVADEPPAAKDSETLADVAHSEGEVDDVIGHLRDRFTSEMLAGYVEALGVPPLTDQNCDFAATLLVERTGDLLPGTTETASVWSQIARYT